MAVGHLQPKVAKPVLQADGVAAVHQVLGCRRVPQQAGMHSRYPGSLPQIPHHLLNRPKCQGATFLAQKEAGPVSFLAYRGRTKVRSRASWVRRPTHTMRSFWPLPITFTHVAVFPLQVYVLQLEPAQLATAQARVQEL